MWRLIEGDLILNTEVARDSAEWNSIVERSPFSVLHHRYDVCVYEDQTIPLIVKVQKYRYLLPLKIINVFPNFKVSFSPIYYYASLLPESNEAIDFAPAALNYLVRFLRKQGVDYLSLCAPTFLSRRYAILLSDWFVRQKASVQVIYAHMIRTGNTTFEDVWRHGVRKRTREEVRKAKREGVEVLKIDTANSIRAWIEDIYRCNVSALTRQGRWGAYPDSYKDVFLSELVSAKQRLKQHFNIYGALYRGHLIAYMVFQEYKRLISLSKAASRTEFLTKHPNDVLIAHVIKEACERKFHWLGYTFDRVRRDGKIPSLYPGLQSFKRKFGFEEVPVPIFRLALSRKGKLLRSLYSSRETLIVNSAQFPGFIRGFLLKLYAPRRRRFFGLFDV